MARVTSWNRPGASASTPGDIAEGYDADIALVDPACSW